MKTTTRKNKFTVYSVQFKAIAFWLLVASCFVASSSSAQIGQWTWMHGDSVTGVLANYGTWGTYSNASNPSGLYEACQWTDTNGTFWLFGGVDFQDNINGDLWQFDPAKNQWRWMNGSGNVNDYGNYGVQGVPDLGNYPPSRSHGMATWTDKNNNLWFFGGARNSSGGSFNDLWRYDIILNEWTWMKGPDTVGNIGVYGTQGVPNIANNPPNRAECAATWVDSAGDLWLFGGQCFADGLFYNDLWRYNIATNTWTWMKGASTKNSSGDFGTRTVENALNNPPARAVYAHLKDDHENLWLFGGLNSSQLALNDIWRYNPVTNNWVWLGGNQYAGGSGVHGTKCIADSNNIPSARFENRACWKDKNGNLWFFGGFFDVGAVGETNELWLYCIETNQWTWVSGDSIANPAGRWGTKLVPAAANRPAGKGGSDSWIDKTFGNLYLYGGADNTFPNSYQDMWKFNIDTNCGACAAAILPIANFQASDTTLCQNDCPTFTNLSTNSTSWIWSFPGGSPSSSTDQNPSICYQSTGIFDVSLIATSYKGSNSITFKKYISVIAAPPIPNITQIHNDTLICSSDTSYISYQWYKDSTLIQGATTTKLIVTKTANYNVKVTNKNGCSVAVGIQVVGFKEYSSLGSEFTVIPNPAGNEIIIKSDLDKTGIKIKEINIYNVLGEKIYSQQQETVNRKPETILDVSFLPPGIYFLQLSNESENWRRIGRFVKE